MPHADIRLTCRLRWWVCPAAFVAAILIRFGFGRAGWGLVAFAAKHGGRVEVG